jgi:hypothetical protein
MTVLSLSNGSAEWTMWLEEPKYTVDEWMVLVIAGRNGLIFGIDFG